MMVNASLPPPGIQDTASENQQPASLSTSNLDFTALLVLILATPQSPGLAAEGQEKPVNLEKETSAAILAEGHSTSLNVLLPEHQGEAVAVGSFLWEKGNPQGRFMSMESSLSQLAQGTANTVSAPESEIHGAAFLSLQVAAPVALVSSNRSLSTTPGVPENGPAIQNPKETPLAEAMLRYGKEPDLNSLVEGPPAKVATADRSNNLQEAVYKNVVADFAADASQRGNVEAARVQFGVENRAEASPGGRSAGNQALQGSANVDRAMTVAFSAYREDQNGKVATDTAEPFLPASHPAFAHSSRVLDATGQPQNNEPQMRLSWSPVVHQVADGILTQIRHNKNEAVLTLDPPELGHLKIELFLDKDQLRAHLLAETADSRRLLQNHLPELKQALQLQHLDLVDVRVDSGSWDAMSHEFTESFQQNFTGERGPSSSSGSGNASVAVGGSLDAQRHGSERQSNGRVSMWV